MGQMENNNLLINKLSKKVPSKVHGNLGRSSELKFYFIQANKLCLPNLDIHDGFAQAIIIYQHILKQMVTFA